MKLNLQAFSANEDINTVVRNRLTYPVRTRYVRIIQHEISGSLSFRCEFYGCAVPKTGVLPTLVPPRSTFSPSSTGLFYVHVST
jgi:hypothetical protein